MKVETKERKKKNCRLLSFLVGLAISYVCVAV